MSKRNPPLLNNNMVSNTKGRSKVVSCSTPEHELNSPSRDSDSESASPVPFLCTQDGAEGETDVIWNYYTPKSEHTSNSRIKSSTPVSHKSKKFIKKVLIEKPLPRRKNLRSSKKTAELFQDLLELNQNVHKFISNKSNKPESIEKPYSGSDDDIFNSTLECSPKSVVRSNNRCMRKSLLSSKFSKPEQETALESDDSLNECLIQASQIVEERILKPVTKAPHTSVFQDSMDSILTHIKLDTPFNNKPKQNESPKFYNDSFDCLVGNLNESALEKLTQMPFQNTTHSDSTSNWVLQDMKLHESPSSKSIFGRHSSMPESPSVAVADPNKPSTSGMIFGRYNSMPHDKNEKESGQSNSPIKCSQDEIRKKHLQAREKLLAKRLLPFTVSQQSTQSSDSCVAPPPKHPRFQPKVPTTVLQENKSNKTTSNSTDLKQIIEKKRQEALMKLRRKQQR